jgi:hypothetical protein
MTSPEMILSNWVTLAQYDRRIPRVHGNGFIQLDLTPDGKKRLHIWHDDIPRQEVATPIHDHVFDLKSDVLFGTLIHEELDAVEDPEGTHVVYRAAQVEGTQNTILLPDEGRVRLDVAQRLVLGTGSTYKFPAWHLHQTDYRGLTVTVMDKLNAPADYGRPRVLVEVGSEPDNDFHRDAFDPVMLWSIIERVLDVVGDSAVR